MVMAAVEVANVIKKQKKTEENTKPSSLFTLLSNFSAKASSKIAKDIQRAMSLGYFLS